jgi:hypothetical protein
LLDATFTYNVLEWKPEMTYNVSGSKGDLVVQQPASSKLPVTGNVRYQWDLRLNNDVPTDLSLELGVGKSDLQLSGLTLSRLDVRMGVGDTMIDLTGNWKRDFDVDIQGGIGQATVRLPRGVGVRVDSKTGIGSIQYSGLRHEGGMLVNDAYGKSPVTSRMNVEAGIFSSSFCPHPSL